MKMIILIITSILIMGQCNAESNLFNKRDAIKKLDRSELESDNDKAMKMDNSSLQFKAPKIGLIIPEKKAKTNEKKKAVKNRVIEQKPTNDIKPKTSKAKLVVSKRSIQASQIKKNDKIVFNENKAYIYRTFKNKIIKYDFNGDIPMGSKGLKKNDSYTYFVINKVRLVTDIRAHKIKLKRDKRIAAKKALAIKNQIILTDETFKKRKKIEKKYNKGKVIKREIDLKQLYLNDVIYVIEDIQFMIRTSTNASFKKKYWLTEKIDVNHSSIKKIGKNKYKVSRLYR